MAKHRRTETEQNGLLPFPEIVRLLSITVVVVCVYNIIARLRTTTCVDFSQGRQYYLCIRDEMKKNIYIKNNMIYYDENMINRVLAVYYIVYSVPYH